MVKRWIYTGCLLITGFLSIFLGKEIVPLLFDGVIVKPTRNTGPVFLVIMGKPTLSWKLYFFNSDANVALSGIYTSEDLDSPHGPLQGTFIISGDIVGIKDSAPYDLNKFPVMKVNKIMDMTIFGIGMCLFFLMVFLNIRIVKYLRGKRT